MFVDRDGRVGALGCDGGGSGMVVGLQVLLASQMPKMISPLTRVNGDDSMALNMA